MDGLTSIEMAYRRDGKNTTSNYIRWETTAELRDIIPSLRPAKTEFALKSLKDIPPDAVIIIYDKDFKESDMPVQEIRTHLILEKIFYYPQTGTFHVRFLE